MRMLVLLFVFFCACSTSEKASEKEFLEFSKPMGFNETDLAYSLKIDPSGKVVIKGDENSPKQGRYKADLPESAGKALWQRIADIDFEPFRLEYGMEAEYSQTKTIRYALKSKSGTIRYKSRAPRELKELEQAFDALVRISLKENDE
jgi:hypothetical protein